MTKKRVAAAARWRCGACDVLVDEYYEIDHRIPLHLGGTNAWENLELLCAQCHRKKTRDERIDAEPWLSVGVCRRCRAAYSKYFNHRCKASVFREKE